MQEIFADKPWVKPLAVAGSHITEETEQKENLLQEQRKMKHFLHICKINEL